MIKYTSILLGLYFLTFKAMAADIPAGVYHNALSYEHIKNLAVSQCNDGAVYIGIVSILFVGIIFWYLKYKR